MAYSLPQEDHGMVKLYVAVCREFSKVSKSKQKFSKANYVYVDKFWSKGY